jgi:hypothetical protein
VKFFTGLIIGAVLAVLGIIVLVVLELSGVLDETPAGAARRERRHAREVGRWLEECHRKLREEYGVGDDAFESWVGTSDEVA